MADNTTPYSVSEFKDWIDNEWQTNTSAEAAKTTYGAGVGLLYEGFEKAVKAPAGRFPSR